MRFRIPDSNALRRGCALAAAAAWLWLAGAPDAAHAAPESARIPLCEEVSAVVDGSADVVLSTVSGRVLLDVRAPRLEARRGRAAPVTPFLFAATEGDVGGHRGFSRAADDDGDGRTDEDRADGVDNDDDGRVDEDYAAVGDLMRVVHRRTGGRFLHLEAYHWDYAHLRRALVLSWDAEDLVDDDLLLGLDGAAWTPTAVGWGDPRHPDPDLMNRTMAVAKLDDLDGEYWIGLTVLSTGADDPVLRMEAAELRLRIGAGCDLAVVVAPTLSQLRCAAATTQRLAAGTPDAERGVRVPWIVPPLQRDDPDAVFAARRIERLDGSMVVEFEAPASWTRLPDPETVRLGGRLLPAPASVSWRPADSASPTPAWSEPWPDAASWRAAALTPHPFLDHRDRLETAEASVWTFEYPGGLPDFPADGCTLASLCGRTSYAPLTHEDPFVAVPEEQMDEDDDATSLSPRLVEAFPNPFVDVLQVRFTVPETIGEAFDLEPGDVLYEKAADPIPYATASPRAMVTVYTVSGRAVATLFDEKCGLGEFRTSWDRLDYEGRPVATGTYFCRLQIENWSVTRRVALIR